LRHRFFLAGKAVVLRHRFFLLAERQKKKTVSGCENPSSLRKKLSGIGLRTFCTRSRSHTSRPPGHADAILIGLEPRMFCTRSKNHTSRPTAHDDAICAVLEARREFLVIIHLMPHQASSKAQQSSSKKSEFQRKLGALNRTRTTDVLHPRSRSHTSRPSSSKNPEFQRKLGALNRTRTTDVLHPKQESYL
jgi:hypothetical protein